MIFKYRYCLKLQYANNDICKQQTLTNGKIQNFRSLIVVVYNSITIERERGGGDYQKYIINYFRCFISPTTSFFKYGLQLRRVIKTLKK